MGIKRYFILYLTSLFLLHFGESNAQNMQPCDARISGQVVDQHSGEPLPFAALSLRDSSGSIAQTLTDSIGNFYFSGICEGNYHILVRYLGYEKRSVSIHVEQHQAVAKIIELEVHEEFLREFTLHADKGQGLHTKSKSIATSSIHPTGGIGADLERFTGVRLLKTGASIAKPMIHGMQGNRVLLINNGLRHEAQQWGADHGPEIDPESVGQVLVIKGATGLRYGSDGVGGVVVLESPDLPTNPGISGNVSLSGSSNGRAFQPALTLEGKGKRIPLSWRIQGNIARSGNLRTPDFFMANTASATESFSGALGYQSSRWSTQVYYSQYNSRIGIFSGAHIGNLTDLHQAIEGQKDFSQSEFTYELERPYQRIEHELLRFQSGVALNSRHSLKLVLGRQFNRRREYDLHGVNNQQQAQLNFNLTTWQGDLIWEHLWPGQKKGDPGGLGIQFMRQGNTSQGRYLIPNYFHHSLGIFWTESLRFKASELNFTLRYDIRDYEVFRNAGSGIARTIHQFQSPSAALSYSGAIDRFTQIQLNLAYAWRPPAIIELYADGIHHGTASYEEGDPNLKEERLVDVSLNLLHQKEHRKVEVDVFFNHFFNYIYARGGGDPILTIRGAFPLYSVESTPAHLYGLDIAFLQALSNHWEWKSSANAVIGTDLDRKAGLPWMPAPEIRNGIRYKWKRPSSNASLGIESQLVARQWRAPRDLDYASAPNAYHLIHLQGAYTLKRKKVSWDFGLEINNLLNTEYRDYLNRFRYFIPELGTNIQMKINLNF